MSSRMRWLLALGVAALSAGPVAAADRAIADLIGYSPDGRYFAYEEYGEHDGSGAPYSAITLIDIEGDPTERLAHFEENGGEDDLLAPMRAKVRAEAAATLGKYGTSEPAQYVGMVGDGEAGANGFALRFGQPGGGAVGEVFSDRLLTLSTFSTTDKTGCREDDGNAATGFSLDIVTGDGRRQIYTDAERLQPWRDCPIDYRIYAVALPYDSLDMTRAVALISVYRAGWEGADRRFMAVAVGK